MDEGMGGWVVEWLRILRVVLVSLGVRTVWRRVGVLDRGRRCGRLRLWMEKGVFGQRALPAAIAISR